MDGNQAPHAGRATSPRKIGRRAFLKGTAFSVGSVALLAACGPTATPTATAVPATPKPASTAVPTAQAQAQPKKGGILRYGLSTDPPHLDPHIDAGGAAALVHGCIYSLLVRPGPKMEMLPDLAESWERPDDLTVIFRLRKNVKWHDGSDFTSADVKASLERMMNPAAGAYMKGNLRNVQKVDAPDLYTLRVTLSQPDSVFLAALMGKGAGIASKALIDKGPDLKNQSVGTGPFKLAERQPGVQIKLVRNENYFMPQRVYLDGITFTPYADDTSRSNALRTGTVDFIDFAPWKDQTTIEADKNLRLYSDKDTVFMHVSMRVDRPPPEQRRRAPGAMLRDRPEVRGCLGILWPGQGVAGATISTVDVQLFG